MDILQQLGDNNLIETGTELLLLEDPSTSEKLEMLKDMGITNDPLIEAQETLGRKKLLQATYNKFEKNSYTEERLKDIGLQEQYKLIKSNEFKGKLTDLCIEEIYDFKVKHALHKYDLEEKMFIFLPRESINKTPKDGLVLYYNKETEVYVVITSFNLELNNYLRKFKLLHKPTIAFSFFFLSIISIFLGKILIVPCLILASLFNLKLVRKKCTCSNQLDSNYCGYCTNNTITKSHFNIKELYSNNVFYSFIQSFLLLIPIQFLLILALNFFTSGNKVFTEPISSKYQNMMFDVNKLGKEIYTDYKYSYEEYKILNDKYTNYIIPFIYSKNKLEIKLTKFGYINKKGKNMKNKSKYTLK